MFSVRVERGEPIVDAGWIATTYRTVAINPNPPAVPVNSAIVPARYVPPFVPPVPPVLTAGSVKFMGSRPLGLPNGGTNWAGTKFFRMFCRPF